MATATMPHDVHSEPSTRTDVPGAGSASDEEAFKSNANGRALNENDWKDDVDDDDDDADEDLGRIRRRARMTATVEEEETEEESESEDLDALESQMTDSNAARKVLRELKARRRRKRRLRRANGETVEREGDDSDSFLDSSESEEEEDEELVLERRFAQTGRLSEDEAEPEEEGEKDKFGGYSSDSSEGLGEVLEEAPPSDGKPKKMTKKQLKKERAALAKEQEKMMRKAARRARFPGWDAKVERVSYLPLIEMLQAAAAKVLPVVQEPEKVDTPKTEKAPTAVAESEDDEDAVELDFDDDEDNEMLKAMLTKKIVPNVARTEELDPDVFVENVEKDEEDKSDDLEDEKSDDSEDESESENLSEEEDMTEEEKIAQRKAAKKFIKADRKKNKKLARAQAVGGFLEDEAEMSEDGGHTSDEDDDDNMDDDELNELAEGIDFREEQDEDERRAAARQRAFMKDQQKADDAELEQMKEMVANGFKRKKGLLDAEDEWKRKRREGGDDDSDEEMDYGPVIERPEEAVELSDDDDGEWREQAARRRALQESGTQESQLPNAFESIVSQDIYAAVKGRMNSFNESQEARHWEGVEPSLARSSSVPASLARTSSQIGAGSSAMLSRQSSKTFLGKKRQIAKANGPVLGNSQASRSYVFGRSESQSQWAGDEAMPATTFREIGRENDARSFGAINAGNVSTKKADASEPKKKQSLFELMSQTQDENAVKHLPQAAKSVLGKR